MIKIIGAAPLAAAVVASLAGSLIAVTARADEPRKIDFTAPLTDFDDKPMCMEVGEGGDCKVVWTLSRLAVIALATQTSNEIGIEQVRRMLLAQDIYRLGTVALDSADITLLCDLIAQWVNAQKRSALLTLRAYERLDPVRVKARRE